MAEDTEHGAVDAPEGGEPADIEEERQFRPRPAAIVAAALAVVMVGGALFFAMSGDGGSPSATIDLGGPMAYHELPEFLVDLQSDGRIRHHIKLGIVAELPQDHVQRISEQEVAVVDAVVAHLRDQQHDRLTGEAGAERLRSELVDVINGEIAPARVRGILFKSFLMD